MTETTQTPAPTLAQLLTAKTDDWHTLQESHPGGNRYHVAAYNYARSCDDYAAAVTRAALNHDAMTDDDRATLENPPDYYASETTERNYAAALEKWRAIVHPQEFDAQPA